MRYIFLALRASLALLAATGLLVLSDAHAQDPEYQTQESTLLQYLDAVGRYSPMEGAYSRGAIGATLGFGAQQYDKADANTLQRHHLYMDDSESSQKLQAMKLFFVKGFSIPVDVGMTLGATQEDHVTMAGAHAQWTLFEGFRVPAVAVRGSYNKVFGMHDAEMNAQRVDAVISMAALSFLTVYVTGGLQRNAATLATESYYAYGLVPQPQTSMETHIWTSRSYGIGTRILLIPPLVAATLEAQFDSFGQAAYAGKVSLDI